MKTPRPGCRVIQLATPLIGGKNMRRHCQYCQVLHIEHYACLLTSAPSERLFSLAGLTIATDRAGLTPENAADLVFLKSVWTTLEDVVASKKRNAAVAGML